MKMNAIVARHLTNRHYGQGNLNGRSASPNGRMPDTSAFQHGHSIRAVSTVVLVAFALAACATPPPVMSPTPATPFNPGASIPSGSSLPTSKSAASPTAVPASTPALLPTPVSQSQAYKQLPEITLASDFKLLVSPLHAQSFLSGGEVRAGAKLRVLATDPNGAWLLVIYDGLVGWIPAIVSGVGVGTLGVMVIDISINPCTASLGSFGRYDQGWESPVSGTVMVEGLIYRPQPVRRDDPKMTLRIEGGGQATVPQLSHKPQSTSSELLQYRIQIDNLQKGSRVRLEAPGLMGEPFAFVLGFFTKNCTQQPNVPVSTESKPDNGGKQVKPLTPITVIVESGPKASSTPKVAPQLPTAAGTIASNRGELAQRKNGWIYQYEVSRNSGRFNDFTNRRPYNGLDCYISPLEDYVRICSDGELHPGWTGRVAYRWESTFNGPVNIGIHAHKIDVGGGGGDGIGVSAFIGQIGGPPQQIGGFSISGMDARGRTETYSAQLSNRSYVLVILDILGQPEHDQSKVYIDIFAR